MDPGPTAPARSDVDVARASHGEMRLLNGHRRPLTAPFSIIGRADGCEVQLHAPAVSPVHCALVHVPGGLMLRDLQSGTGTRVNGEPVTLCMLREGDVISVGPFEFHAHLPAADPQTSDLPLGAAALHSMEVIQQEKEALRIQAAAVVAQQTALTEAEMKLGQRELALRRQEEQLAAHLEAKRGQMAALQEQVGEARATLRRERADFEQESKALLANVDREHQEATASRQQAQLERKRFIELRRRLKRRWHRHWAVHEADLNRRAEELEAEWQRLASEAEKIAQGNADLKGARLCLNAEMELGQRRLKDERAALARERRSWVQQRADEQGQLRKQFQVLTQRESLLAEIERELLDEKEHWEGTRVHLEKEIEGLQARARHLRQKLLEQQEETARQGVNEPAPFGAGELANAVPVALPVKVIPAQPVREIVRLSEAESERLNVLERLTGDLADQRVHLVEQLEWLVSAEDNWRQAHAELGFELEAFALHLREREQHAQFRERQLQAGEADLRQRREEIAQGHCHLDAWRARLAAREAAWVSDRATVLAHAQLSAEQTQREREALDDLRRRWKQRRHQESTECQTAHRQFVEARALYATLWEDCLRRTTALDQEKRTLAEQTLALEQYRLEVIGQADDVSAAERQLERHRRRWAALFTEAERNLARERKALEAEIARVEARSRQVEEQAAALGKREAKLSSRQTEWEHQQSQGEEANSRLSNELECLRIEREQLEFRVVALRDEVERMAHTLLEQSETLTLPAVQAA
jgi:hypothetical protein